MIARVNFVSKRVFILDILTHYEQKLEMKNELLKMDFPDEHFISSFIDIPGDIIDEYETSSYMNYQNLKQ